MVKPDTIFLDSSGEEEMYMEEEAGKAIEELFKAAKEEDIKYI